MKEMVRWAKAHVQSAQVEANRKFFDEFDALLENDAIEAYEFLRDHRKSDTASDVTCLEINQREEAHEAKRLPPRVVILPDWGYNDGGTSESCVDTFVIHGKRDNQQRTQTRKVTMEARVGIEPTYKGFADLSLTTWVPRLSPTV
jgi:hypothetical protein